MAWYVAPSLLEESTAVDTRRSIPFPPTRYKTSTSVRAVKNEVSTPPILGQRNRFKMIGTDTAANLAQMVHFIAGRNLTHPKDIGVAMSVGLLPSAISLDGEEAVPVRLDSPLPEPASVFVAQNHVLEPLLLGSTDRSVQGGGRHNSQGRWSQ